MRKKTVKNSITVSSEAQKLSSKAQKNSLEAETCKSTNKEI